MLKTHVEEYFKLKKVIKDFNADVRDLKKEHEVTPRIEELNKEIKKLRTELATDKMIMDIKEDLDSAKERFTLLKDIILQEMMEEGVESVPHDGKMIKVVQVMKEAKDQSVSTKSKKDGWDRTDIEIDENIKVQ